jgi:hypothetical protein
MKTKQTIITALIGALSAVAQVSPKSSGDCIQKACTITINYPYDAKGEVDTRPGTWGRSAFDDGPIKFRKVPDGYRVRIKRVYGNVTARIRGRALPHTYAGVLFGLITTASKDTDLATLSQDGCMLYLQADVGPGQARIVPFDVQTHAAGLLEADNTLIVRRAVYLNETEASVHVEPSLIVEFKYEKTEQ